MEKEQATKPVSCTTIETYSVEGICPFCRKISAVLMDEDGEEQTEPKKCEHLEGWDVEGSIFTHGFESVTFHWKKQEPDEAHLPVEPTPIEVP